LRVSTRAKAAVERVLMKVGVVVGMNPVCHKLCQHVMTTRKKPLNAQKPETLGLGLLVTCKSPGSLEHQAVQTETGPVGSLPQSPCAGTLPSTTVKHTLLPQKEKLAEAKRGCQEEVLWKTWGYPVEMAKVPGKAIPGTLQCSGCAPDP